MARQRWQGLSYGQIKQAKQLIEAGWTQKQIADHFFCILEALDNLFPETPAEDPAPPVEKKPAAKSKARARAKTPRAGSPNGKQQD